MELQDNCVIALDIDGTTTHDKSLSPRVADFLNQLLSDRWEIIFVTGRTFSFAKPILSSLKGSFLVIVQNGAACLQMPGQTIRFKHFLPVDTIFRIDPLFKGKGFGLLVESGIENDDICYYKESDFSETVKEYLSFRQTLCPEKWVSLSSFDQLPIKEYAAGKYFAMHEEAEKLKLQIETIEQMNVTVIRDPFRPGFHLAQLLNMQATKDQALKEIIGGKTLIAAGDDVNDLEMLKMAKIKIVMETAPAHMLPLGDIVASSAKDAGIIAALEEALKRL